jgi:capsular exopolysaccharide synthesis family protein
MQEQSGGHSVLDRLGGERDAARLMAAVRRRWWVVALIALIAGAGAYVLAKRKPKQYSATASLLFQDSNLDQKLFGNQVLSSVDPSRLAATNAALVELPAVARQTAARLGVPASVVAADISFGSNTTADVMPVTATTESPSLSARMANTYVRQYIAFRQAADRSQLAQAQQLVNSQLAAIPASEANATTAQTLRSRSYQLQLLASLQTGNAEPVQTAVAPTSPSAPTPSRDGIIGAFLGLLVGCMLAFILERRDRTLKTAADIEEVYRVPVIGVIPESRDLAKTGSAGSQREQDAFRMIRAQLRYFDVDRDIKRVMVSSAEVGEGKSTIALGLARAVASSAEGRALLIEADLRRPSLADALGIENVVGLSELLSHASDVAAGLRELVVTPEDGGSNGARPQLDVLLAGGTPPNPLELLESKRMSELLDYADSVYDLVIIDAPPLPVVSDPIALVHHVDGLLLVARLGHTHRDRAARLVRQIGDLKADVLGVVINGVPHADTTYGGYGYGYGYTPSTDSRLSRSLGRAGRREPTRSR